MQQFPNLKLVLAHGGYPAVVDALALATKHPNFYLSPDIYAFFPGGQLYRDAIVQLPDQFIFGTAYPLGALKESVEGTLKWPLPDEVMEKFLYGNAARLLKI
jgi:predicted TIM-barrel fold metal-dependent hydrolase